MKNKLSILHYIRLSIGVAFAMAFPALASAAEYIDWVDGSFSNWTLQYGTLDARTSGHSDYYFDATAAAAHYGTLWNAKYKDSYGSLDGSNVSGLTYAPDWTWSLPGRSSSSNDSYRFECYSSNHSDVIFRGSGGYGDCVNIDVIPSAVDGGEGYTSSMRVGSSNPWSSSNEYGGAEFDGQTNSLAPKYSPCADRMYRDITVDKDHPLLKINYCAIMKNPSGHNSQSSSQPAYSLRVYEIAADGTKTEITGCTQSFVEANTLASTGTPCTYKSDRKSESFVTTDWKSALWDLSAYVDKTVRIEVSVHDCLFDSENAGSHYAYIYFTARSLPVTLDMQYCSEQDPVTLTAPSYFDKYIWTFKDNKKNAIDGYSNLDRSSETGSAKYTYTFAAGAMPSTISYVSLKMVIGDNADCSFTLDSAIRVSKITPDIKVTRGCQRYVTLSDNSVLSLKDYGDEITDYQWTIYAHNDNLGDYATYRNGGTGAKMSFEAAKAAGLLSKEIQKSTSNFDYQFDANGQWVELTVTNKSGCTATTQVYVVPNEIAMWDKEDVSYCQGDQIKLTYTDLNSDKADSEYPQWSNLPYFRSYRYFGDLKFYYPSTADDGNSPLVPFVAEESASKTGSVDYNVKVVDRFGCTYTDVYTVKVDPEPTIYLDRSLSYETNDDGAKIFYVCPGSKQKVSVYSYVSDKFITDLEGTPSVYTAGTASGSSTVSASYDYPVGTYYWEGLNSSSAKQCKNRLTFTVAYHADSVSVEWPTPVCPFGSYEVTCENADLSKGVSWWAQDASSTTHVLSANGKTYTITNPGDNPDYTYYCKAYDIYGCSYNKVSNIAISTPAATSFRFNKVNTEGATGANMTVSNTGDAATAVYDLGKLCDGEGFVFTPSVSDASVKSVVYSYYTNEDPTVHTYDGRTDGAKTFTSDVLKVQSSGKLEVYVTIQPYNSNGDALCSSKATIKTEGYPEILVDNKVNGDYISTAYVCDGAEVKLSAEPYWAGQTADQSLFTIDWEQAASAERAKWEVTYTGSINDATTDATNGHYFSYNYVVTSKVGGCQANGAIQIYVSPIPSFELDVTPAIICSSDKNTVTLNATDNASTLGTTSDKKYDDASVYRWTFSDGTNAYSSTTSGTRAFRNVTAGGDFTVTATTKAGCEASLTKTVSSSLVPEVDVYVIPYYNNLNNTVRQKVGDAGTAVCAGNLYKLLVKENISSFTDDQKNQYNKLNNECENLATVTIQKTSAPYNVLGFNSCGEGSKDVSNKLWSTCLNYIDGQNSTSYTSGNSALFSYYVAGSTEDTYTITYTTPCGCTVTKNITIPTKSVPAFSLVTDNLDYICDNDPGKKINITINTSALTSTAGYYYYWVNGWQTIGNGVSASDKNLIMTNNDNAEYSSKYVSDALQTTSLGVTLDDLAGAKYHRWTVNIEEKGTGCMGVARTTIYRQMPPEFNLDMQPEALCSNEKAPEVKLNATATADTHTPKIYYYSYNKKSNGWDVASWGTDTTSRTVSVSDYYLTKDEAESMMSEKGYVSNADTNFCVRGGEAYIYGYENYRTTDSRYFCYDSVCVAAKTNQAPKIKWSVFVGSVENKSNAVCVGNTYDLRVVNNEANGYSETWTLTDLDTREVVATANSSNGQYAYFTGLEALSTKSRDRYRITCTNESGCTITEDIVISINAIPVVKLTAASGISGDYVKYCANNQGVDLLATVANASTKSTYTYYFTRDSRTTALSASGKNEITVGDGADNTAYALLKNAYANNSSSSTKNDTINYSVYTVDDAGCTSDLSTVSVVRMQLPTLWRETPETGCSEGTAVYRVYERTVPAAQSNVDNINFTPAREYHAYSVLYDRDKNEGERVTFLKSDSSAAADITEAAEIASLYPWYYYTCDAGWNGTARSCTSTRMTSYFKLPLGKSYRDQVWNYKTGKVDASKTYVPSYYYITCVDKTSGCVGYELLSIDPTDEPDKDSIYFNVGLKTTSDEKLVRLSEYDETKIYKNACPGDYIFMRISDRTTYNPNNYYIRQYETNGAGGKISYSKGGSTLWGPYSNAGQYQLWDVTNNGWAGATASTNYRTEQGATYSTNMTVKTSALYRLYCYQSNSGRGATSCPVTGDFRLEIVDAPTLSYLRDHACVYDSKGNYDGQLKFRAVSSAVYNTYLNDVYDTDGTTILHHAGDQNLDDKVVHHYSWYDGNNTTMMAGYDFDGQKDVDTFKVIPNDDDNLAKTALTTNTSKTYTYYLRDDAEGYCNSTNIPVSATLYMNPVFDLTVDPAIACEGSDYTITVAQNYGYARNVWYNYYWGKTVSGSAFTSQYNNNASNYSHVYTQTRTRDAGKHTIDVTASINYNPTMTYNTNSSSTTTYLKCYTTNSVEVSSYETPLPVLSLTKVDDGGSYLNDERILEVSSSNTNNIDPDKTTERKICPGETYTYYIDNLQSRDADRTTTNEATYYTITDVTDSTNVVDHQSVNTQTTAVGSLTHLGGTMNTDSHKYSLVAVSSNGCESEALEFQLPIAEYPNVSISNGKGAVCADGSTLTLAANATNGAPFTYEWYTGSSVGTSDQIQGVQATFVTTPFDALKDSKYESKTQDYTVRVFNNAGCSNTATTTVKVWPLPQFNLSLAPEAACSDATVKLTAKKADGELNYTTESFTYSWLGMYNNTTIGSSADPVTTSDIKVKDVTGFDVTAQVKTSDGISCTDNQHQDVSVYNTPELVYELFKKDGNVAFDPATDKLCPNTEYYIVLSNKNAQSESASETYYLTNTTTGETAEPITVIPGAKANADGSVTYAIKANTTYVAYLETGKGCQSTKKSFTVLLAPTPTITVTGPSTFCKPASGSSSAVTLTASASGSEMTWKWNNQSDYSTDASVTSELTVSPTATATYSVSAKSKEYGCAAYKEYVVTMLDLPTVSIDAEESVCAGNYVTLNATISDDVTSVVWSVESDGSKTSASGKSFEQLINKDTKFTATATASNGCTAVSEAKTVYASPIPTVKLTFKKVTDNGDVEFDPATDKLCKDQYYYPVFENTTTNTTLCSGQTFYFNTDEFTSSTATANLDGAKNYQMNGNIIYRYYAVATCGEHECKSNTETVTLTQASSPVISVTTSAATFCEGATTELKLTASTSGTGNSGMTYKWDSPATSTAADGTTAKATPSYDAANPVITYTVTGTNANGCEAKGSISVTGLPTPTFDINPDAVNVCNGSSTTLTVENPSTPVLSYAWFSEDPSVNTSATSISTAKSYATPAVSANTSYYAVIKATNGCQSKPVESKLTVVNLPEVSVARLLNSSDNAAFERTDASKDSWNLCNGASFYPEFKSAQNDLCLIDSIFVLRGTTTDVTVANTNSVAAGHSYEVSGNATYRYYAKSSCGCVSEPQYFTVTMAQSPIVNIVNKTTSKNTYCAGSINQKSIELSAQSSSSIAKYTWSGNVLDDATGASQTNNQTVTVIPTQTTYAVDVVTTEGCTGHAEFAMTALAQPIAAITGDANICSGTNPTLTAVVQDASNASVISYIWTKEVNGTQTTDQFASSETIKPTQSETEAGYKLQVINANGCKSEVSDVHNVYVSTNPSVTFVYDGGVKDASGVSTYTVCEGNKLTIKPSVGSAAAKFTWYADAAHSTPLDASFSGVESVGDDGVLVVNPTTAITHYFVNAVLGTCQGSGSTPTKAQTLPVINYTGNTTLCAGETLSLTGVDNYGYTYSFDGSAAVAAGESFTLTGVTTSRKNVNVIVTDNIGCTNSKDIAITVNEAPEIVLTPEAASVCDNSQAVLTVAPKDAANADDYSYTWVNDETPSSVLGAGASFPTPRLSYGTDYVFDVIAKSSSTQCTTTKQVPVTVKSNPVLTLNNTTDATSGNVTYCNDGESTADLDVSGADSYVWSNNVSTDDITTSAANHSIAKVKPSYTTTYRVTGSVQGCESSIDVKVEPLSVPTLSVVAADYVCSGESVEVSARVNGSTAKAEGNYSWTNGKNENTFSENIYTPTEYSVTYTAANSCKSTATKTVNVYSLPTSDIQPDYTMVCADSIVNLTAVVTGGKAPYYYTWTTDANANYSASAETISPRVSANQTFSLTVSDYNGCKSDKVSTQYITVQPLTTLENSGATTYCEHNEVKVNLKGATEYQYNNDGEWTTDAQKSFNYSVGTKTISIVGRVGLNGTYDETTKTYKKYCQTAILPVTVTINSAPVITWTANSTSTICEGQEAKVEFTVTGLAGSDYTNTWTSDPTISTKGYASRTDLESDHTFSVTVVDNHTSACSSTATYDVKVFKQPKVSVEGLGYACAGSAATITAVPDDATANYTYSWTRADGTISHENPYSPVMTNDETFQLVATDAHNCSSNVLTKTVNVQKAFNIENANAINSYCEDKTTGTASASIVLNGANVGGYYTINNNRLTDPDTGDDTNTYTVSGLTAGTYYYYAYGYSPLTGTGDGTDYDLQYCRSSQLPIEINVNAAPKVTIDGDLAQCAGVDFVLTASAVGATNPEYTWSTGENDPTITRQFSSSQDLKVVVVDNTSKCSGEAHAQISVFSVPEVTIDASERGTTVCEGTAAVLNAVAMPAGGSYSYVWKDSNNKSYFNETIYPVVNNETLFTLYVEEQHGSKTCKSASTTVTVKPQSKPNLTVATNGGNCQGDAVNLVLGGASTYYVNDVEQTSDTYTEELKDVRTYRYHIEGVDLIDNKFECVASKDVEVTPHAAPSVLVSGSRAVCKGGLLDLVATGASSATGATLTYSWSDNSITSDKDGNPVSVEPNELMLYPSGSVDGKYQYTVTVTEDRGCQTTQLIEVSTLESPVFGITTSDEGVCTDQIVTLTAVPADGQKNTDKWTYSWSGGTLSGATGVTVSTLVKGKTDFTAIAKNESGCTSEQQIGIRQYDLPAVNISYSLASNKYLDAQNYDEDKGITLCDNDKVQLLATPDITSPGIDTYSWDGVANTQSYVPEYPTGVNLNHNELIVTSVNGCQKAYDINVTMQQAPAVSISTKQQYCYGDKVTLTGQGATSYEWPYFQDPATGKNITDATYDKVIANKVGTETYTLWGYSQNGCKAVATVDVNVVALPDAYIQGDNDFICFGDRAQLTVKPVSNTANYSYSWSTGENATTIYPYPSNSGDTEYSVIVNDNTTACQTEVKHVVTANAVPEIAIAEPTDVTNNTISVCSGAELAIRATGAREFYWSYGSVEDEGEYLEGENFITTPTSSTTYKVLGVNKYTSSTGKQLECEATTSYYISVKQSPSIQLIGKSEICYGDKVSLTATGLTGYAGNVYDSNNKLVSGYVWNSTGEVGTPENTFTDEFTAATGQSVIYTVTGYAENGCSGEASKTISMLPKTIISIDAPSEICENSIATLKVSSDAEIKSYRWDTNEMGDSISHTITKAVCDYDAATSLFTKTYAVTATDLNNCKVTENTTMQLQEKLELTPGSTDYVACSGSSVTLTVGGASSYVWDGLDNRKASTLTVTPINDTVHTVVGKMGVCEATIEIPVRVVSAPVVAIQGDLSVCMGDNVTLSAYTNTNATNATYDWSTIADVDAKNASSITTVATDGLTKNTKFSLVVTDAATQCQGKDEVEVVVNNLPNVKIDGDKTPCANTINTYSASGANSYLWKSGSSKVSDDNYSLSVGESQVAVDVTGYDNNGCQNTTSFTIDPVARPEITISGATAVCAGDGLQLSAVSGSSCTYNWIEDDDTLKTGNTLTMARPEAGTYVISTIGTLKSKAECSTTINTTINVLSKPELYITGDDYPCQNTQMTVQAHGSNIDSYVWKASGTDDGRGGYTTNLLTSASSFNATLRGTNEYSAYTDAQGNVLQCTADSVFTFNVHAAPLVTINGETQSCMDGTVTLTATSPNATIFNWGNDGAGATITPVITEDRTAQGGNPFECSVIDNNRCTGSATYDVTVTTSPEIRLSYSTDDVKNEHVTGNVISICENENITFTVQGAERYVWTEGVDTWEGETYTPASTDVNRSFSITAYRGNCETTENYKITIKLRPTAWLDGSTNACQNDTVNLQASGADHYEWKGVGSKYVSTSATAANAAANDVLAYPMISDSIAIRVLAYGTNGCYTAIEDTLTLTPTPELFIKNSDVVCVGAVDTFRIINPNTKDYVYVWDDSFSDTTYVYRATEDATTDVKVQAKVKGIGGCSTVKTLTITNRVKPTLDYTATGEYMTDDHANKIITICANTDLQIAPNGATKYKFVIDNDTTEATRIAKYPATDNVYTVIGTDNYGCVANEDIVVKVNAAPVVYSPTYGVPDADGKIKLSICLGNEVTLNVNGADSYEWQNSTADDATGKKSTVSPTQDQEFYVTGLKSSNGCPSTVSFDVHIYSLPDVLITDNKGMTGKDNICVDDRFVLRAVPGQPDDKSFKSYIWKDENGSALSYRDSLVDYSEKSMVYTVTVTDTNRCSNTAKFTLNAVESPKLFVETNLDGNSTTVCSGSSITLYGRTDDNGFGANTYIWMLNSDTVATTASLTAKPNSDLTYTYIGKNKYGCETTVDVPISIALAPTIWVDGYGVKDNVSDTIKVCKYQDLTLNMMGDADEYEWPNKTKAASNTYESIQMSQNYAVTGINDNGCKTQLIIPVQVLPSEPLAIDYNQNVCDGTITTLKVKAAAGAYDNYLWSNNMLGDSTDVVVKRSSYTDATGKVVEVVDTTITVTGYNSTTGCSNTVKALISIKKLPTLEYEVLNSSDQSNKTTTFCKSDQVTIYAKGAHDYVWQDGTVGDAFVNMPASTDVLKVIGSLEGCSDSLFIPVTILTAPVIWADGLKPICKGDELTLTAKGAQTYEWSDGTKSDVFTSTPLDTTTYQLTGTAANGCKSTVDVVVYVRELPTVTIDGSSDVCLNAATDLKAVINSATTVSGGNGNTYRWYIGDNVISTQSVLNYVISDKRTAIKLVGSDPAGCSNTANITINGKDIPVIKISGKDTVCAGQKTAVYASGAASYQWINGKDTLTGNLLKVAPNADVVYNLVATSSSNCKADTTVYVTVNQVPDVNVLGNTDICFGNSVSLTGSGAKTYSWSDGTTGDKFTATPISSTKYQVTGTDENGCSAKYQFSVNVIDLPKFTVDAQSSSCAGQRDSMWAAPVNADDNYTFYWTTKSGISLSGDTVAPLLTKNSTIYVTAIDENAGCQAKDSFDVTVFEMPKLAVVGKDSVCLNSQVWLIAQNADTKSYVWTANGDTLSTEPELKFIPTGSTTVLLSGAIQNCRTSIKVPVTVVAPPYLYIATEKDTLCRGSEMSMQALGADSYVWDDGSTDAVRTVSPLKSTVYSLVGTNKYGCVDSISKTISVIDIPTLKITASKNYVCPNQTDSVSLEVSSESKISEYTWTSVPYMYDIDRYADQSKFTAHINDTTVVYVHGVDEAGCVGVDSFTVYERPQIDLKFNVNPSCVDNDSRRVRLTGITPESATWTWDMGDGRDTVMGEIATYMYQLPLKDSFLVSVHTVDAYGCIYDGESYIYKWRDFWAPEAFSPNNDGLNDKFKFRGGDFIEEFNFVIYDRLGEIVFKGNSINDEWDGTYKGKACPQGVYGWYVTYSSNTENLNKSDKRKGYVSIIR